MAVFFDAPVSPEALTAFAREVPVDPTALATKFPVETVGDNQAEISSLTRRNGLAKYRSFDGRLHVADRGAAVTGKIKLPALSDSLNMGEYERLQMEFSRTGGTRTEALEQAIYNDAQTLVRNIHNRLDMAVGEVLATGQLNLTDETDDFAASLDYGAPADNLPTAAVLWTDPTADIIGDLQAWTAAYAASNGVAPATVWVSRTVMNALTLNTGLIGVVGGEGRTRVSPADINSILGSWGLPQIEVVDKVYTDGGEQRRAIPEDRAVFVPANPGDLLNVTFGVTATALELVDSNHAEFGFEQAPGIAAVVIKEGPPFRQFTFVDAVALPVVNNANMLFSAKVA